MYNKIFELSTEKISRWAAYHARRLPAEAAAQACIPSRGDLQKSSVLFNQANTFESMQSTMYQAVLQGV
jgi:hypothetical protein